MFVEQIFFIFILFFSCLGPPAEREYRNQFLGICSSSEENENNTKKPSLYLFILLQNVGDEAEKSADSSGLQSRL